MMIRVKRIHEPPEAVDGVRFLVDRLWPRGVRKESAHFDHWLKDAAPSNELRRWFGHSLDRWPVFRLRYFDELDHQPYAWEPILDAGRQGNVTLLYAARDTEHNNAVALQEYLARRAPETAGDAE